MSGAKGAVHVEGLVKAFGSAIAVDDVSFSIPSGSYCCILGPSGCGKTTTLRMISGHDTQTSGAILIDDSDMGTIAPAQRPTAMMFQNYALFPHMSVEENVAFSLRVKGSDRTVRKQRAGHLLELVEMSDYADRKPNALSGGQQQRVALARALMMNPSVLALDEPLSALDPFLRLKVRAELKALQRRLGITFLHVTHSQSEALALADQIILMNNGKLEQVGTAEDLYHRPASAFAAQFMGDFVTVKMMSGGQAASVGVALRNEIALLQYPPASAAAVILLLFVLAMIFGLTRIVDIRKEL